MPFNSQSTFTIQNEIDKIKAIAAIAPLYDTIGGYNDEPTLTAANDVITEICAVNFPHKWNRTKLPLFYTNSFQQDYALINKDGSSVLNIEWLENGVAFDINNTSVPKPWVDVECGRSQPQRTGTFFNTGSMMTNPGFTVNSLPNSELYYGEWGQPNFNSRTLGNNPGPGSVYTNPVNVQILTASWQATAGGQITFALNYLPNSAVPGSNLVVSNAQPALYNGSFVIVSTSGTNVTVTATVNPGAYQGSGVVGQAISQPSNPITQIIDANGNFLLLTTYGTEGTTAPVAPVDAKPGTTCSGAGATTIWTVLDPQGMGIRILQVPSQTGVVWQFRLVGQKIPPRYTTLGQTLAPFPDKYESFFREGLIAQLFKYSPFEKVKAQFDTTWNMWKMKLNDLRETEDRELEEYMFVPARGIMSRGTTPNRFEGAAWPFNYPRP